MICLTQQVLDQNRMLTQMMINYLNMLKTPGDNVILQNDIMNLNNWIKEWLLKLNICKCKSISYGRNIQFENKYKIENIEIENINHIKDLGVIFDNSLRFNNHINEKVNRANSMLGAIKRNFRHLSNEAFIILYKSLVRTHLEYAVSVWNPHFKKDIEKIEKVQMRATKIIKSIAHLSYEERLKKLKLPTLKYRRIRGDVIETYKILSGQYDACTKIALNRHTTEIDTRGNYLRLTVAYSAHTHFKIRNPISISTNPISESRTRFFV